MVRRQELKKLRESDNTKAELDGIDEEITDLEKRMEAVAAAHAERPYVPVSQR